MRKSADQIAAKRRERFETMAVRLANYLEMSNAERFDQLPPQIREHFSSMKYSDLVQPLMVADHAKGVSIRSLSTRYGLAKSTVELRLKK